MAEQPPYFKSIDLQCKPNITYNFTLGSTGRVGHLTAMSFSNCGVDLIADTPVADPTDPESQIKVVGVFDYIRWDGKRADPHSFEFRVSPANQGLMQSSLASLKGGTEVSAQVAIYEYDHDKKIYFPKFTSESPIKYVITFGSLVNIDTDPATDITQPTNFICRMSLTAKSDPGEKQMHSIAYTAGNPFNLEVGVPVGA